MSWTLHAAPYCHLMFILKSHGEINGIQRHESVSRTVVVMDLWSIREIFKCESPTFTPLVEADRPVLHGSMGLHNSRWTKTNLADNAFDKCGPMPRMIVSVSEFLGHRNQSMCMKMP